MSFLYEVGLADLAPERVYHTRFGTNEFTAVLRKWQHAFDRDKAFTSHCRWKMLCSVWLPSIAGRWLEAEE
jgi:hypothetical protein